MNIPFTRIPFELAEPGTDPTQQHNPHPKRRWSEAAPYIVLVVVFLAFGYVKFIRPKEQAKAQVHPTPIVEPTRGGFLTSMITPSPTPTPAPATPTPTATPLPIPTPTPSGQYGVFVDGEQIICWCTDDGQIGPVDDCLIGIPSFCNGTPTE